MAIALGGNSINKAYLGSTEIQKMYLGSGLIFSKGLEIPTGIKLTEVSTTDSTPIMTNFRVEDATPTHVHFDTPLGPISSLSTTDFAISGRTILAVDTTLNYFTVDTAFNYWDNNTIRKEGGNNDVVYDFTLESISNNIPVPTIAPANYRYVAENGSDSADGLTEGTAWLTLKHALQTTPSGGGYQIWVKVGTYLGENIVQADMDNGAEGAPYRITGYKNEIGDITSNYYTLTPNTAYPALDSTEMPLFDGGDSSTGRFIYNDSINYYIWENLQVTGYAEAFRSRFSNVQGQQVINSNVKDMGVIGSNYGYGVYWVNETVTANRNRILGSNFINCESNATQIDGEHSLTKGCKVYSNVGTTGSEGTDYYYATSGSNNIYLDNLAYNDGNGGHNGHGFSAKTGGDGLAVHYNLYDNCEAVAIQGAFQARHANCKFNVWKNSIARADIPNRKEGSSDNYTGCIDFQSGGDQNVFENLTCHDTHQFIRFNLNGESDTDPDIQTNALIKNCLVYDVKNVIDANSVIAGVSAPSGNKLANCTIKGADNMFWQWAGTGSVEFGINKIENCIIENVPTLNKDEVVVGWTYSYDFSWDIWLANGTPITGTDNESMDTLLDANYQPQATFTDIDVPKINNVFYGKNGIERQDLTTVGGVLSAEEVPGAIIPTITVSNTDGTADFSTVQAAIDSGLVAGDIVGLKAGDTFEENVIINGMNGSDGNPIRFTSYGTGALPIITNAVTQTLSWSQDTGARSSLWVASVSESYFGLPRIYKNGVEILRANWNAINPDQGTVTEDEAVYELLNYSSYTPSPPVNGFEWVHSPAHDKIWTNVDPTGQDYQFTNPVQYALEFNGCSYVDMENIEIKGGMVASVGVQASSADCSFTTMKLGDASSKAFYVNASSRISFITCNINAEFTFDITGPENMYTGYSERGPTDGGLLQNANTDHVVYDCLFTNWLHASFVIYSYTDPWTASTGHEIYNNTFTSPDATYGGGIGIIGKGSGVEVHHNYFKDISVLNQNVMNGLHMHHNIYDGCYQTKIKDDAPSATSMMMNALSTSNTNDIDTSGMIQEYNTVMNADTYGIEFFSGGGGTWTTFNNNIYRNNLLFNCGVSPTTVAYGVIGSFNKSNDAYYETYDIVDNNFWLDPPTSVVINGDFSNGSYGWTLGAGWTVPSNVAVATASDGDLLQPNILVIGRTYDITFDLTVSSGSLLVRCGFGASSGTFSTTGTKTVQLVCTGSSNLDFIPQATFTGTIDNVVVTDLTGGDVALIQHGSTTKIDVATFVSQSTVDKTTTGNIQVDPEINADYTLPVGSNVEGYGAMPDPSQEYNIGSSLQPAN